MDGTYLRWICWHVLLRVGENPPHECGAQIWSRPWPTRLMAHEGVAHRAHHTTTGLDCESTRRATSIRSLLAALMSSLGHKHIARQCAYTPIAG
jgi:hypothetical protein